jgi:hypothetical protein
MTSKSLLSAGLPLLLATFPAAAQQWAVVDLHPSAIAQESHILEIQHPRQVGYCDRFDGGEQGGLWLGSAASWTPISSPVQCYVTGVDGELIVGSQMVRATMWVGEDHTQVDLHPNGVVASGLGKVRGNLQSGGIGLGSGIYHAAYWRGTTASFVDLHPPGATQSETVGTDGLWVGGSVVFPGPVEHAYLWNTASGATVDLHPPTALVSHLTGMAPGVQVGEVTFPGTPNSSRPALWRGTPQSFVDFGAGKFTGTTGRIHSGGTGQGGFFRAAVNLGTPQSWIGLHQYLPPGLNGGFSGTTCVFQDGPTIYVGGWAESSPNYFFHAVMWIGTDPCYPNCDQSTVSPILNVLDFNCFLNKFASGDPYANCDGSTTQPKLNVLDFNCFLNRFVNGCP